MTNVPISKWKLSKLWMNSDCTCIKYKVLSTRYFEGVLSQSRNLHPIREVILPQQDLKFKNQIN